ncbi:MAG: 2Fe-2S iron-sulfur cluster-binding protein [Gammaproteobacteria bacterium]|nr:2Fe-2S iron-sulfur cluster-binding protein [Gammaproteobacteria bacterium]
MPKVTYIQADGGRESVEIAVGASVMDGALDFGIGGILGQCGGGCTCLTCHCYVDPQWASRMPAPSADELELLEYAYERRPTSRLSCQIFLTEQLQGLCIEIPIRQT